MRAMLKLPPATVVLALDSEAAMALLKAVSMCGLVLESEAGFTRPPDGERDLDQYVSLLRYDDPRVAALLAEAREEAKRAAMDQLARLEATLTGRPIGVPGDLAPVVPHRRRGEEDA